MGIVGLIVFFGIAWVFSESKSTISKKTVWGGIALQAVVAFLVLGAPRWGVSAPLSFAFQIAVSGVESVLSVVNESNSFLFGKLADKSHSGVVFALHVLPTIIFFSALTQVGYHLGILQKVVQCFAFVMRKFLGVSGPESLAASAEIFLGQTESPLMIRPYLNRLTRSELFSVMVGGMATVAGGVLAAFIGMLSDRIPDIAGHLLTASVLAAPAALVVAKIMIPENPKNMVGRHSDNEAVIVDDPTDKKPSNVIEAASRGASEGLTLALNVGAMLIAFIALIALLNMGVSWIGGWFSVPDLSASKILGYLFAPFAYLIGVPWGECVEAGTFLGQKVAINEFVAYSSLSQNMSHLSDQTIVLLSYALCGFANFASIGIQIGGTGGLIPHRKSEIAKLGLKAVLAGNLVGLITACWANLLGV